MASEPSNIYEDKQNKFSQETERLASFDLPTKLSVEAIGHISPGMTFLDIGAGPNTQLFEYVKSHNGQFVALDTNADFLARQNAAGAKTVQADIRELPLEDESFDITHTRFVIAHLGEDKQKAIKQMLRVTKSGGLAVFMDYDWSSARGSDAFNKLKGFMINGGFLFDADFGAELKDRVKSSGIFGEFTTKKSEPTFMTDYSIVIKLREAGSIDLSQQGKNEAMGEWNKILDKLQVESESDDAPGFYFPGVTTVTLRKD